MNPAVLDASALLAYLRSEPGSELVREKLRGAYISAVNLSEVFKKVSEKQGAISLVKAVVGNFQVKVVNFDAAAAQATAELDALTKGKGLSLADRACLALAQSKESQAFTSDRRWQELSLPIEVVLFRGNN